MRFVLRLAGRFTGNGIRNPTPINASNLERNVPQVGQASLSYNVSNHPAFYGYV